MKNRIQKKFSELKEKGHKGLIGYLTAGDPDVDTSMKNIRTAIENGLDILELGVPFSDPTADGPVIQEASHRAIAGGMTVGGALEMVRKLRRDYDLPIVLFGYANPFFRYGYEKLCRDGVKAGIDALLVVDLPNEETGDLISIAGAHGIDLITLIAPTTPDERASMILKEARGFVYYISVAGVTGTREHCAVDIAEHVVNLRKYTDLPIAVGFGISNGSQAREVAVKADAVVVGSAFVNSALKGDLSGLVKEIAGSLHGDSM